MLDTCRHGLDTGSLRPLDHHFWPKRRRDIDIGDSKPHQRITHGAARDPRLTAIGIQQRHNAPQGRILKPGLASHRSHA
ncbi:hypothetical protein D3C87_2134740 [compost metagenome]